MYGFSGWSARRIGHLARRGYRTPEGFDFDFDFDFGPPLPLKSKSTEVEVEVEVVSVHLPTC
jgi:hypothetical protein